MDRLEDLRPGKRGEVVLRAALRRQILLFLISTLFVAAGGWVAYQGRLSGWLVAAGIALAIAGAVMSIMSLLPGASFLRLASSGFTVCALFRSTTYRWEDIRGFMVVSLNQYELITVHTTVGFDFAPGYDRSRLGRALARAVAGCEAALPDTYGLKAEDLAALLNEWRERHSPAGRP